MQCALACASAHSRSGNLLGAVFEEPKPAPRIHIGPGPGSFAFPNKCRHCYPAPCATACMPRAITRDAVTEAMLVNPSRCINCGMCSMACPFGVIRYREDQRRGAPGRVAVKCDNRVHRQKEGLAPACVAQCKTCALRFGDPNQMLKDRTRQLAREVTMGIRGEAETTPETPAVGLWRALGEAADQVRS
jgi:carbon-monoxide dehydrogenase iron sulfur subunit